MKTLTIRDFRSRPREAQAALAAEKEAVLTSNGKPVAVMVSVSAESLPATVAVLRRARALQAVSDIRQRARVERLDALAMKDVDAEIDAVRATRRKQARKTGRA